jgi:hypothetical protein
LQPHHLQHVPGTLYALRSASDMAPRGINETTRRLNQSARFGDELVAICGGRHVGRTCITDAHEAANRLALRPAGTAHMASPHLGGSEMYGESIYADVLAAWRGLANIVDL